MAVAGLLLSAFVAGPASADSPAVYAGSASGQALVLTVANQGLTAGASSAKSASDGTASAMGAGAVGQANTTATAAAGETKPEVCATVLPPAQTAPLNTILSLGLGCGSAAAPVGAATGTGKVAGLDVNLQTAIDLIPQGSTATTTVTTTLQQVLDAICAGAAALPVGSTCTTTASTINQVVQSVTTTKTLSATLGSSTSSVTASSSAVTSESTASGAVINILPSPVLNGVTLADPLATITVARADAKAVCDLGTGKATPSFDPALVRIKLSTPLVTLLPTLPTIALPTITTPDNPVASVIDATTISANNGEITVAPGTTIVLFPGTPIQTTIGVANGSTKANADGSVSATSDGVRIAALENIGTVAAPLAGGILLNLAHADAAVGCSPAVVDAPAPTVDTPRELPRTGGGPAPWLPAAGALGLVAAFLARRALVRSH
jgi:hypothetical protein